jgi:hypothetical protein
VLETGHGPVNSCFHAGGCPIPSILYGAGD